MNFLSDVTGFVAINAENDDVVHLLEECLTNKSTIGVTDFNDISEEKDMEEYYNDKNLNSHMVLDFSACGSPCFEDNLKKLKNSVKNEKIFDSRWSLVFDYTEKAEKTKKDMLLGICNGMKGFREKDFEIVKIKEKKRR